MSFVFFTSIDFKADMNVWKVLKMITSIFECV